jgi:radical SAM protein (TIGR04043 family)
MQPDSFEFKVELLFKGLKVHETTVDENAAAVTGETHPDSVDKIARRGGAGPAGGIYVRFENLFQANVPMQEQMVANSDLLLKELPTDGEFQVYKEDENGALVPYRQLAKIPAPSFYDDVYIPKERNEIGTPVPYRKIALVHGTDCVATTINQSCKYWRCGSQCVFCAIENSDALPLKDPDALVAFTEQARKEQRVSHFTLTTGTQDGPDGGALEYLPFVEALKANFKYPVHVQISPVKDLSYLDRLYSAGVDNIGIHVETYPDTNRHRCTPGKSEIPLRLFQKNWDYAVQAFGDNQVESYLLVGLGESETEYKQAVEFIVGHEVIPFIVPARAIADTELSENRLGSYTDLVRYYLYAAKRLKEQGLDPRKARAGCVRCGLCSAIGEAVRVVDRYP